MMNGRTTFVMIAALAAATCGGGGSSAPTSPSPSPSPSPSAMPTVTISATGVSPSQVRIEVNQVVRFTNNGQRTVEMRSDPHPTHEFCPPLNEVGTLTPGQSRNTGTFTRSGTCTYHDHLDAANTAFRGSVVVGDVTPSPTPGPYYGSSLPGGHLKTGH
jgi:plastocyanin